MIKATFKIITFISLILTSPASFAQDWDRGYAAAEAGDYETALRELQPLAADGHEGALAVLGAMYHLGSGVEKDNIQAYFYFAVGDALGYEAFSNFISSNSDEMSAEEIDTAKSLVTNFLYMKCQETNSGIC
jgi:hypothetical protein